MVKKISALIAISLVVLLFVGCRKGEQRCEEKNATLELPEMKKYAEKIAMNYTVDETGILYEIVTPGEGANPTLASTITVKYTGKLLNDVIFDSNQTGATFALSGLIGGWQIAIPKLKPGGKMKLILPSNKFYSYGCSDYFPAVKNQILYFDIELVKINN
jgi:FKBP-type peptidyl-prolyl cis-trans isomerase FkpA